MMTEEQVLREIDKQDALLMEFRGNYEKQQPIGDELTAFLNNAFHEEPQLIVDLFWKYFGEPTNNVSKRKPPYCTHLFAAIIDSPNPYGVELACQLLIQQKRSYPYRSYQEDSARFLYDAKDPAAIPYLIKALDSDEYEVVREAALALGNIGDSRAEPYLLALVDKYNNDEVYREDRLDDAYPIIRSSAFNALCLLNTPVAQQKILQSIFQDRDPGIQERAIRYLAKELPSSTALTYLEKLTKHSDSRISVMATNYLKDIIDWTFDKGIDISRFAK